MLVLATLVAGCKKTAEQPKAEVVEAAPSPIVTPTAEPAAPAAEAPATTSFDIATVAVSTVKLGAFPYLALPTGYIPNDARTLDVARFPFWVNGAMQWVEGKVYMSQIDTAPNKSWSKYEVQRNLEALIKQVGGQKLSETKIPKEATDRLTDDDKQAVNVGLGDIYNSPSAVYLIHQADRDIWIHFTANSAGGNWAVVEAMPFVASAKLIPATPAT